MVKGPVSGNVLRCEGSSSDGGQAGDFSTGGRFYPDRENGKLRTVLERCLRDHSEKIDQPSVKKVSERLSMYIRKELQKDDLDTLRGIEGDAAHQYFSV